MWGSKNSLLKINRIIDLAINNGINKFDGVSFSNRPDETKTIKENLIGAAIDDARRKVFLS